MIYSPEIVEAVKRHKLARRKVDEIAMSCGLTFNQVVYICKKEKLMKPKRTPGRVEIILGDRVESALRDAAEQRGVKFNFFMRELLRRTVQDKLISAILDDGH